MMCLLHHILPETTGDPLKQVWNDSLVLQAQTDQQVRTDDTKFQH